MTGKIQRSPWPHAISLVAMIILFTVVWLVEERFLSPPGWQRPLGQLAAGEYDVERVIDGDTIVLASNQLRVRLQGIDTPETVKPNAQVEAWGDEASAYTTKFVADAGWRVRLEIDGEPVDRYGRHLAFVWSGTRLLNEELVARGLARAKTNFDFSQGLKQRLRRAQADASNSERGLWRPQTADE